MLWRFYYKWERIKGVKFVIKVCGVWEGRYSGVWNRDWKRLSEIKVDEGKVGDCRWWRVEWGYLSYLGEEVGL